MKVLKDTVDMYMDEYLVNNLDRVKEILKKDWDAVFLYDGYEGSGKSVKAMQDAYYIDQTLTLDRVCFDPKSFTDAVHAADKHQAVVYDEAYTGMNSRASMSVINRALIKMLAEIRQKMLFVAIVMPTFFDLDRYAALWRSRALVHIYTGPNFQRGFFSFYNMEKKKELYTLGKKYYSYSRPKPNFRGRFTNFYPLNQEEYRQKKKDALLAKETVQDKDSLEREFKNRIFHAVYPVKRVTKIKKAEIIGIEESTYRSWERRYQRDGELFPEKA